MKNENNELNKIFVVGDKFKCFMTNENIVGVSRLQAMVNDKAIDPALDPCEIYIGQGVCEIQMKKIFNAIKENNLDEKIKLILPHYYHKSSRSLTHKHRNENIMISEPVQIAHSVYRCNLMLNDSCAEMSDHVTGHHIQGMVVIEAARQMVLAISEKYLISENREVKPNFVTNSMEVKFKKFIFPLQVKMSCHVNNIKKVAGNNLACDFYISFIQNDEECVTLKFNSSVLDSDYISEKEANLASECIKSHLDFQKASIARLSCI